MDVADNNDKMRRIKQKMNDRLLFVFFELCLSTSDWCSQSAQVLEFVETLDLGDACRGLLCRVCVERVLRVSTAN